MAPAEAAAPSCACANSPRTSRVTSKSTTAQPFKELACTPCPVAIREHRCNLSYLTLVLVWRRSCYLGPMKPLTLLALILIAPVALSQDRHPETQVAQADAQLNEAIKQNEAARAAAFYAEDFVLT